MQLTYESGNILKAKADALVLPVYQDWKKSTLVKELDATLGGLLLKRGRKIGFNGKSGKTMILQCRGEISFDTVVLWGMGKREAPEAEVIWDFGHKVVHKLKSPAVKTLAIAADFAEGMERRLLGVKLAQGIVCGGYRFEGYKSNNKNAGKSDLKKVMLFGVGAYKGKPATGKKMIERGMIIGESVNLARDLINIPAENMTPAAFASRASAVAKGIPNLTCKVETEAQIKRRKMGLFLAVARGSHNKPRLVTLTYSPKNAKGKPIVLVGKGLMFDSGGYSLKPSSGMETMKCDMSGSAAVLGAIAALAKLKVKRKVIAVVAACENMIGGGAYRVGDVYKGMSGKTVEVLNTDAEGRLTLADALTYGQTFGPELIVDVATLTGACVVALGEQTVGLFGSSEKVSEKLLSAFDRAGEDVWELPLNPKLKRLIKSDIADMKNTGGRWGGAITAGLFLQEFIDGVDWAHLDIAGPAFRTSAAGHLPKGGTGVAVSSLVELVDPKL